VARRRVEFLAGIDGGFASADRDSEEGTGYERANPDHEQIRDYNMLNFSCLARAALLCGGLVGLAACAGDGNWQRANTADAVRAADYRHCRGEAKSAAGSQLGINQDIAASRGGDWRNEGDYTLQSERNSGSADAAFSFVLSSCMEDKGYSAR
jgi:hypothetical protein